MYRKRLKKVYGIELVEEAVRKANENARLNNIDNAKFIAGDVFEKLDELEEKEIKPDIIILDPPKTRSWRKDYNEASEV